jgi:uncharacterized protein (TIGR02646 family)
MRYIPKGSEPDVIKDFKTIQQSAGLPATYNVFRDKSLLNQILRHEQHNICCYCQRRIDHYQGNKSTGAHNEHLYPQSKDPGDGSVDLEYKNIFACCIVSKGQKEKSQHCGEAKGEKVIIGSITDSQCQDRFKYNLIGEILPNGPYNDWSEYIVNYNQLSQDQKKLVDEIKVLNLNCNSLVEERKNVIESIALWAADTTREDVIRQLKTWETANEFPIFYNTIQYILKNT